MSCFGKNQSPDLCQKCCNADQLCEWSGNLNDVVTEPIYVQKVFDAVLFNLQGLKSVSDICFTPSIPKGHRLKRVIDIRCKRFFNPHNIDDPCNLTLDIDTSISGAVFIQKAGGETVTVVGPDGTFSEKVLYAETDDCDDKCMGTPIFGTQNIKVTGDVLVTLDLLLCDRCDREVVFTVCANVNLATCHSPLLLTNFFEMCLPSTVNTAFLPRFTEFCNPACETRLATNNIGRDITVCPDGKVKGNLIVALCVTCEKKIVIPVQLCVLSTGYVQLEPQVSAICTSFPSLFPNQIRESDTLENCGPVSEVTDTHCDCDCDCQQEHHHNNCYDSGNSCCDDDCYAYCPPRPQPRR
ncbi:MAG: hypothetical protein RR361_00940 [Anaerovorax sp.]